MLEIICPILLVLVGCLVVQIDIFEDSKPILCNNDVLASFGKQVIYYGSLDNADLLLFQSSIACLGQNHTGCRKHVRLWQD